ncbi:sulfite reductase (NADPH) flavoprotein alpha-component [Paraburkholderia fungorum]|uniref:NADPH--hemoprotein reductase n=1 Tax=Paraburkholderia fungorum TaxID=134537 RepID=A0A1H1IQM7_9BURK|nr:sulfite reductase (NADPH) flavoprotein alpha-component [Paraburkholderia fungorum]
MTLRVFRPDGFRSTLIWSALSLIGAGMAYFGETRLAMAGGVIVAYLAMCVGVLRAHRRRSRQVGANTVRGNADNTVVLVAYASQTGFAEQLAVQTAQLFRRAGRVVQLESLDTLGFDALMRYNQALFIVSTTGEGDAPDNAVSFVRKVMSAGAAQSLQTLHYAVLALGDRNYRDFCAFGHMVDRWLRDRRAQSLFDLIEVNNGDPAALRLWHERLSSSAFEGGDEVLTPLSGTRWILDQRNLLNPGSAGNPAFHVCLKPDDPAALNWQPGDIAEIRPQHPEAVVAAWLRMLCLDGDTAVDCDRKIIKLSEAISTRTLPVKVDVLRGQSPQVIVDSCEPLPSRKYSISSLPADGRLELLVRQARYPDASSSEGIGLGLASGWLTRHAPPDASISVRVRTNRGFHAPSDDRPLILIGAGTGLAGLRAHLKHRAECGHRRNWLIFGERSAAHDTFHADEIAHWRAAGVLERLDQVWSRDGGEYRYVHDAIRGAAGHVQQWVEGGASIYVCGSAQRMAQTVQAALVDVIGEARVDSLREAGRYRRDVY